MWRLCWDGIHGGEKESENLSISTRYSNFEGGKSACLRREVISKRRELENKALMVFAVRKSHTER